MLATPWPNSTKRSLIISPGKTISYEFVAHYLRQMFGRHNIQKLAFDRWKFPSPAAVASQGRLQRALRRRAPDQPVFRRQHPIGRYVLDFYCAKARLAIELDGMSHDTGNRLQRDLRRAAWLRARGITVVRIPIADLMHGIDEAADAIVRMAAEML